MIRRQVKPKWKNIRFGTYADIAESYDISLFHNGKRKNIYELQKDIYNLEKEYHDKGHKIDGIYF